MSTHTLNPNTGWKIMINGVRFLNLLKHGFKYNKELSRLYDKPLSSDTPNYVPKSRMISPNNRLMIIGGYGYSELLRDNYKPRGGKWMKKTKEEAKEYDNDPNINAIFSSDTDDSTDDSDYPDDIDEFGCDEDGHAILHSKQGHP